MNTLWRAIHRWNSGVVIAPGTTTKTEVAYAYGKVRNIVTANPGVVIEVELVRGPDRKTADILLDAPRLINIR